MHNYHDDFVTPGNSPLLANSLKQIRHKPKRRIKERGRPQSRQRLRFLVTYFGFFRFLTLFDVLDIF